MALGVEFLADSIGAGLSLQPMAALVLGLLLIPLGLLVFAIRVITLRNQSVRLTGIFVCRQDHTPISVPEYRFGDQFASILNAGFAENKALRSQWRAVETDQHDSKSWYSEDPASRRLVEEAAEYFVLDSLSLHLSSYFNQPNTARASIVELNRDDIPRVLLDNRFLSLFSTPMQDRPAFGPDWPSRGGVRQKSASGWKLIRAFSGEALYHRLSLILPKGSTVTRSKDKGVVISTPRLRLSLRVDYGGYAAFIPPEFCDTYLKTAYRDLDMRQVSLVLRVSLKPLGLLLGGWEQYRWVDSFIRDLQEKVSFERFMERIAWPSVAAYLRCENRVQMEIAAQQGTAEEKRTKESTGDETRKL